MTRQLIQSTVQHVLNWAYETAITGVRNSPIPALGSAEELAQSYLKQRGSLSKQVDSLIRWQTSTAAATGFASNLGGLVTLPLAIPANISIVLVTQLRMIATIAHMGGYDIRDDQVRSLCFVCLCGSAASDVLKGAGIQIGGKLTTKLIESLSFATIKQINQAVGFRLITKFGNTGVVNLGKAVPFVGGIVGAAFDGTTTSAIGHTAKWMFVFQASSRSRIPHHSQSPAYTVDRSLRSFKSSAEQTVRVVPRQTKRYIQTFLKPKKSRR